MVLLGTAVVSGTATSLVLATGRRTAFGDIATRLRTRAPDTEFDRGIKQFGSLIMKAVFGLVMFILVVRIGTHRSAFESVLFAIALAVGLTPELLPMITSVTLTRGAVAMAKQKVIVKHLSAIQNLGSIDILCSDKTGTLTRGIMAFDSSCDALGNASEVPLFFARLNGSTASSRRRSEVPSIRPSWRVPKPKGRARTPKSTKFRSTSSVVACRSSSTSRGSDGSSSRARPEGILAAATAYARAGTEPVPLDDNARAKSREAYEALSTRGFRVLAVAAQGRDQACVLRGRRDRARSHRLPGLRGSSALRCKRGAPRAQA